ncbi:zinc-binding protein [Pyrodictium occultum]|uniref:Zinc-binding protein n=1 Tax=Pyrodictium occultum TaxID=2309 RepID=A0A0V8RUJ0_PYROC|nr:zinc-binding protein [Pyrodictium occultum]KSW11749.1 zinc-binding protein [Pyrodictium occultum]
MGRRRKRRKPQLLRAPRTLPTVFECPHCGAKALTVEINKKERNEKGEVKAIIRCGRCGLYAEMWVPEIFHPVDVYSKFLDAYLEGKIEYSFTKEEASISLSELASQEAGEEEGEEAVEGGEAGESREGAEKEDRVW